MCHREAQEAQEAQEAHQDVRLVLYVVKVNFVIIFYYLNHCYDVLTHALGAYRLVGELGGGLRIGYLLTP